MAGTEFVGSHEKAENNYGQNGSPQPSSLTPGQAKSPIKDVAPPQHGVESLQPADHLSARVKMTDGRATPITPHSGMTNRSTSSSETVPHTTSSRRR